MDTFDLPKEYQIRTDIVPHDDRGFKDEWQDEVYREARLAFNEYWSKSVLDYGCGSGFKLMKHFGDCNVTGVEVEPCLSFLREKYPNGSWFSPEGFWGVKSDFIICADVIEHVEDPGYLLDMFSVFNAALIISTPDRSRVENQPLRGPPKNTGHIREWTFSEFKRFVERYFSVKEHEHCADHPECQWILATP